MKMLIKIAIAVVSCFFVSFLVINPVSGQSEMKGGGMCKMIPDDVMKIVDKSCSDCHAEPGNKIALSHVNLAKWDKYSAKKQAAKSKAMCNMVTKDRMPPKNFRDNHPDAVPTREDIKKICDWSASLQVDKK